MHAVIALCGLCLVTLVWAEAPPVPLAATTDTHSEPGFSVQTGYEGYLVPSVPATPAHSGVGSGGLTGLASLASALFSGGDAASALASLLGGAELLTVEGSDRHGGQETATEGHKIKLIGAHGKPVYIPIPFSKHPKFPKFNKFDKLTHNPKKWGLIKIITKLILPIFGLIIVFLLTGGIAASVCAFTPLCTISFLARENVRSLMSTDTVTDFTSFVLDAIEKYQELQKTSIESL